MVNVRRLRFIVDGFATIRRTSVQNLYLEKGRLDLWMDCGVSPEINLASCGAPGLVARREIYEADPPGNLIVVGHAVVLACHV